MDIPVYILILNTFSIAIWSSPNGTIQQSNVQIGHPLVSWWFQSENHLYISINSVSSSKPYLITKRQSSMSSPNSLIIYRPAELPQPTHVLELQLAVHIPGPPERSTGRDQDKLLIAMENNIFKK